MQHSDFDQGNCYSMAEVEISSSVKITRFKSIRIPNIKMWQVWDSSVIVPAPARRCVPLDKVIALLVLAQSQKQRRGKVANSQIIAAAETKEVHNVIKARLGRSVGLDLEEGFH